MLSRRQFLVRGGSGLGAWLVGAQVARTIIRLAEEKQQPYLVEVEHPEHVLWATMSSDRYILTLDCAYVDMEVPHLTWREWLTRKSIDVCKEKDIRDFLESWGWFKPHTGERWVPPELDDELPDSLNQHYLDWDYAIHDAPTALAFDYLRGLQLANRNARGEDLGSLVFAEGTMPGNNDSLVMTKSTALVGGLQQRLLQLGERVEVVVDRL